MDQTLFSSSDRLVYDQRKGKKAKWSEDLFRHMRLSPRKGTHPLQPIGRGRDSPAEAPSPLLLAVPTLHRLFRSYRCSSTRLYRPAQTSERTHTPSTHTKKKKNEGRHDAEFGPFRRPPRRGGFARRGPAVWSGPHLRLPLRHDQDRRGLLQQPGALRPVSQGDSSFSSSGRFAAADRV